MTTNKGAKYATSFEEIWLSNPNYQDRQKDKDDLP